MKNNTTLNDKLNDINEQYHSVANTLAKYNEEFRKVLENFLIEKELNGLVERIDGKRGILKISSKYCETSNAIPYIARFHPLTKSRKVGTTKRADIPSFNVKTPKEYFNNLQETYKPIKTVANIELF